MSDTSYVSITHSVLQAEEYVQRVQDDGAGAITTFTGVTRNTFNGKDVIKLEYEAYEPMARGKLQVHIHLPTSLHASRVIGLDAHHELNHDPADLSTNASQSTHDAK